MSIEEELNQKYDIHQVIQKAISTAHSEPSPYTIKMFDDIKGDIKEIKEDVKSNLVQATKTNGRVSRAEEWSEKAQKIIEHNTEAIETLKDSLNTMNASHKSDKRQAVLAVTVATVFLGTIGGLGYKVIQSSLEKSLTATNYSQIEEAVDKAFIKRVKNVNYEK